jgi:hypothetical protein
VCYSEKQDSIKFLSIISIINHWKLSFNYFLEYFILIFKDRLSFLSLKTVINNKQVGRNVLFFVELKEEDKTS